MDIPKLEERTLAKLKALMIGMPRKLKPDAKMKVRQLQFAAAKTLLNYFQKRDIGNDAEDDPYDLPKTEKALKQHLADIGKELSDDESA